MDESTKALLDQHNAYSFCLRNLQKLFQKIGKLKSLLWQKSAELMANYTLRGTAIVSSNQLISNKGNSDKGNSKLANGIEPWLRPGQFRIEYLEIVATLRFFCCTSFPLARTRWVQVTLSSLCLLFQAVPSIISSNIKIKNHGHSETLTQGC